MVGMKINKDEWEPFLNRWQPIVDNAFIEKYGHKGGEYDTKEDIRPRNKRYCEPFFKELCITTDGEATICCRDYGQIIVGNVKRDGVRNVWVGPDRKRIGLIMRKRGSFSIPYCRDCNL